MAAAHPLAKFRSLVMGNQRGEGLVGGREKGSARTDETMLLYAP